MIFFKELREVIPIDIRQSASEIVKILETQEKRDIR